MNYGIRDARRGEANYAVVDGYTLAHLGVGAGVGAAGVGPWVALGITILWEILEDPLKRRLPEWFPVETYDTLVNQVGDSAAFMIGWWVGSRLAYRRRWTP